MLGESPFLNRIGIMTKTANISASKNRYHITREDGALLLDLQIQDRKSPNVGVLLPNSVLTDHYVRYGNSSSRNTYPTAMFEAQSVDIDKIQGDVGLFASFIPYVTTVLRFEEAIGYELVGKPFFLECIMMYSLILCG
jgi:hypothetical protein